MMKKIRIAQIGTSQYSHGHPVFNTIASLTDVFEVVGYALPENEREKFPAQVAAFDGYKEMTVEEMKAYINAHMARHKVPKYIDFVSEFPMNAAGKILKYKMRENAIEKLGLQKAAKVVTA